MRICKQHNRPHGHYERNTIMTKAEITKLTKAAAEAAAAIENGDKRRARNLRDSIETLNRVTNHLVRVHDQMADVTPDMERILGKRGRKPKASEPVTGASIMANA